MEDAHGEMQIQNASVYSPKSALYCSLNLRVCIWKNGFSREKEAALDERKMDRQLTKKNCDKLFEEFLRCDTKCRRGNLLGDLLELPAAASKRKQKPFLATTLP